MKKRRPWLALSLIVFAFASTGCQWLQNEFFTLDVARPEPVHEEPALPW